MRLGMIVGFGQLLNKYVWHMKFAQQKRGYQAYRPGTDNDNFIRFGKFQNNSVLVVN
jgi:hypothetical protein